MQREYGVANTQLVSRWIDKLHEPMLPNSSVRDLVTLHRELHSKLNIARGYVIQEDVAVRALIQATKFSLFYPSIVQWLTDHVAAADQTFNALATHLCQIELVTKSLVAPAAGTMYSVPQANHVMVLPTQPEANAVTSVIITNADILKSNNDILKAIQNLSLSASKPKTFSGNSKTERPALYSEYCWTHGQCGHSSASCKKPNEGHVSTATAANPVGGRTSKWARIK